MFCNKDFSSTFIITLLIIPSSKSLISLAKMQGVRLLSTIVVLALASLLASATDPGPLQDFCVAVNDTKTGCKYIFTCILLNYHCSLKLIKFIQVVSYIILNTNI